MFGSFHRYCNQKAKRKSSRKRHTNNSWQLLRKLTTSQQYLHSGIKDEQSNFQNNPDFRPQAAL